MHNYGQHPQQGYPPQAMQQGYPQQAAGPPQQGYPPQAMQQGYPQQAGGPLQPGYPPQQGYAQAPPQQFAPAQQGYANPPQQAMNPAVPQPGGNWQAQSPLDLVGASRKLAIKQKVDLLEAVGDTMGCDMCTERPNNYEIFDEQTGAKLLHAKEESGFCWRCWCNPNQPLKLHLTDPRTNQEVMIVDRPFKCAGPCPAWLGCCQQEATLFSGNSTENPSAAMALSQVPVCGGLFTPTVNVSNQGNQFAVVEGPCCCFGGMSEMCCDQEFPVSSAEGKAGNVAMIVKERPENASQALKEIMTDSDLFTLTFKDPSLQQNQKLALLSTVLLLDYLFFEQNQPFECDGSSCSITCCNMYICGCLVPIKCKVCGGGSEDE